MNVRLFKYICVVTLLGISVASWYWAVSIYQNNKTKIITYGADIMREIALPIHMARMEAREPVTELPVPVYSVILDQIDDTWGAARDEGRTHDGTDIFAPRGAPVFSSTEGYVIRTNIGTRGGRNVMVLGPGGLMYYYAHFERIADGIKRGQSVTTDTVLGFVGNSGNATNTPPHLHFGIYPRQWDAINPYPMLVDRW